MSSLTFSSESGKTRHSAAGLIICLHQDGYNYDFTVHDRGLFCVQSSSLYQYEHLDIAYQSQCYDEVKHIYKFIYTVKTSCAVKGIVITEKSGLETRNTQSNNLINGLDPATYNLILGIINRKKNVDDRLLIKFRDKIFAVSLSETALFYLEHKLTRLVLFDGRSYIIQKTMDELEKQCGDSFFRINRQFIVNKDAIKELTTTLNRTMDVSLKFDFPLAVSISKHRTCHFLNWFAVSI